MWCHPDVEVPLVWRLYKCKGTTDEILWSSRGKTYANKPLGSLDVKDTKSVYWPSEENNISKFRLKQKIRLSCEEETI